MDEPTTDLARNATVHDLVAACTAAAETIRASFAAIVEAERVINAAFSTTGTSKDIWIKACDRLSCRFDEPEAAIARIERQCWTMIVERLELRRIMSVSRWDDLCKSIRDEKLPAITIENVHKFARFYSDSIDEMHAEAIREIFNWLRPPGSKYKTNTEFEIREKVILGYTVERACSRIGYRMDNTRSEQQLIALENVLNALDGNGMISKSHYSAVQTSILGTSESEGETPLFEWKAFKNGNLHLRFKRLDLLAKLNAKAGGLNLKP